MGCWKRSWKRSSWSECWPILTCRFRTPDDGGVVVLTWEHGIEMARANTPLPDLPLGDKADSVGLACQARWIHRVGTIDGVAGEDPPPGRAGHRTAASLSVTSLEPILDPSVPAGDPGISDPVVGRRETTRRWWLRSPAKTRASLP